MPTIGRSTLGQGRTVHSLWASMPLGGFMLPFFDNDAISSASIPGDFVICFSVVQVEMLPSDHYDTTTCQVGSLT